MNTHSINVSAGRGGNNFKDAMSNIAREAEAQRMLEERAQRRQALVSKIKKVAGFLFGAALLGTAFYYHNELQDYVSSKFASKPQISASTSASLNKVEAAAEKRDQTLDEITK